jgi:hypothetical protein
LELHAVWEAWLAGTQDQVPLLGLPVMWWGRIGKCLQFALVFSVLADLYRDRLQRFADQEAAVSAWGKAFMLDVRQLQVTVGDRAPTLTMSGRFLQVLRDALGAGGGMIAWTVIIPLTLYGAYSGAKGVWDDLSPDGAGEYAATAVPALGAAFAQGALAFALALGLLGGLLTVVTIAVLAVTVAAQFAAYAVVHAGLRTAAALASHRRLLVLQLLVGAVAVALELLSS